MTIAELAQTVRELVRYEGEIRWDSSRPDGQPRRQLDVSGARSAFGFVAETTLAEGLRRTIDWYQRTRVELVRSESGA